MKDLKLYIDKTCLAPNETSIMTDEKDIISQAYIMLFYEEPPNTFDQIHFKVVETLKQNYNIDRVEINTITKSEIKVTIYLKSGESIQLWI